MKFLLSTLLIAVIFTGHVSAVTPATLVVGMQGNILTAGTASSSTFSIDLAREENLLENEPIVDLSVSGLPSGAVASFMPTPVIFGGLFDGFSSSTLLIINIDNTVPSGSYPFVVSANGLNAYDFDGIFATGTLVVTAAPVPEPPAIPVTPPISSGGGIVFVNYGGNSNNDSIGNPIIKNDNTTNNGASTSFVGTVLGANTSCGYYMNPNGILGPGLKNDFKEINLLQKFLNDELNLKLKITGNYDNPTLLAVQAFQNKYAKEILTPWGIAEPTKFVYYTTIMQINNIVCKELNLKIIQSKLIPISNSSIKL